jgi:probable rRNA maturation factor
MTMDELQVEVSLGDEVTSPVEPERIEAAVRHVLRSRGVERAELSVALLGDAEMASLNEQYLRHEGTTDAITFALHEEGDPPLGDVYIGVEQAVRQAAEFGATPAEEVLRLAVHGTLHVLGFEHPEGAERVDSEMFRLQESLLMGFLRDEG